MHLTTLPILLRLVKLKNKQDLPLYMHPISSQVLQPQDDFFSFTITTHEVSLIVTEERLKKFPKEGLEMSPVIYKPLQIDDIGIEQSGQRINQLSECLALAGISIFYLTTYQTDFILVKESTVPEALAALKSRFHVDSFTADSLSIDLSQTKPIDPSLLSQPKPELSFNLHVYEKKLQIAGVNYDLLPLTAGVFLKTVFFEEVEFFSFTISPDGISIIVNKDAMELFPPNALNLGFFESYLRLVGVDLQEFTLEQHGIVNSLSRPLVEGKLNILLISTFATANTLLEEDDLEKGLEILKTQNVIKSISNESC